MRYEIYIYIYCIHYVWIYSRPFPIKLIGNWSRHLLGEESHSVDGLTDQDNGT